MHSRELTARWTTNAPILRQRMQVLVMSAMTDGSDAMSLDWQVGSGSSAFLSLEGVLGPAQQVCTGTLSGVVAKNRASPGQLLNAALCAGTGQDMFVVNATHPSEAWTYRLVSGATWALSQPLLPQQIPINTSTYRTEVDTWANGDAITVYQPPAVAIAEIGPSIASYGAGFNTQLTIAHLKILDPAGAGNSPLLIRDDDVSFVDTTIQPVIVANGTNGYVGGQYVNVDFQGGAADLNVSPMVETPVQAGIIRVGASFTFNGAHIAVGADAIVGASSNFGNFHYGSVYVDTGVLAVCSGTLCNPGGPSPPGIQIWGPGTFAAEFGLGRVTYAAGAGQAAATFLNAGGLLANNQTKGCLMVPSATTTTWTCNLSLTPAVLDAQLGGTTGCLGIPGGSIFCNGGP